MRIKGGKTMSIPVTDLGARTKMVGRQDKLDELKRFLYAPGSESHFVYYWAEGGLGKTRLLEELIKMVKAAGPKFHTTGIIDLYHTDTHSTSDLERTIVESLDPQKKYFSAYRQERQQYELLREKGTDPSVLERRRQQLGDLFVEGCQEMALEASKLVLCFDTVEVLQYESSVVEEMAKLDTADTRVKPWLLGRLSTLSNVLVVFVGRPKKPAPGESGDPQQRLIDDMVMAFGEKLTRDELKPLNLEETRTFIKALAEGYEQEIIPEKHLPIAHMLTQGRPIFLHLIADLICVLAPGQNTLQIFDEYGDLLESSKESPRLKAARREVEHMILEAVFNGPAELNWYLKQIALAPKGVDAEIFQVLVGCSHEEAQTWIAELERLSFVKRFTPPAGGVRLHPEHIFLHDEMYQLLTSDVDPHLRREERAAASRLVDKYYAPQITQLEEDLAVSKAEKRIEVRERLQKLQVEQLYYLLVTNVPRGYNFYKVLTETSSRNRWVGFGMRLLDEFLRFYNNPTRHSRFEHSELAEAQIIRESAWLWVERFYWWGQIERLIPLASKILEGPESFHIYCKEDATSCSVQDLTLVGNIYAFWAYGISRKQGFDSQVMTKLQAMIERFPKLTACTDDQALALARLSNANGYQHRLGGMLREAIRYYSDAQAAFRSLGSNLEQYYDEYASLLNNFSYLFALLGRMDLARPLAHEALRINEVLGNPYTTGLTLSTLSQIACMRENFDQAINYAEEALALFREIGESRGAALAHLGIAQAKRKKAKHELEKGRKGSILEEARHMLEEARDNLNLAQSILRETGIESMDRTVIAEQGRLSRDLGRLISQVAGTEEAMQYYTQSARQLREALALKGWANDERADVLQDLTEVLYDLHDEEEAENRFEEIQTLIGKEYLIIPGEQMPKEDLPTQNFEPLGKAELMRGQTAFAQKQWNEGAKHYVLAYIYFTRFSTDAVKIDIMIEYLYNHLRDLPLAEQQSILRHALDWIDKFNLGEEARSFVATAGQLFGI
jgi:tetratricopeptide (TPR) repeat protein